MKRAFQNVGRVVCMPPFQARLCAAWPAVYRSSITTAFVCTHCSQVNPCGNTDHGQHWLMSRLCHCEIWVSWFQGNKPRAQPGETAAHHYAGNAQPDGWHTAQQCLLNRNFKVIFKIVLFLERMDNSCAMINLTLASWPCLLQIIPVKNSLQATPSQATIFITQQQYEHDCVYIHRRVVCKVAQLCKGSPVCMDVNHEFVTPVPADALTLHDARPSVPTIKWTFCQRI